jgi:membrane protein required for colicin V production
MNWFDLAVIGFIALSAIFAFARGFVREALSIVAWIGAAAIAWYYSTDYVKPFITRFITDETLAKIIAWAATFLVSLIVLTILTSLIARTVHYGGLSAIDRTLGFIFGLARGAFILALAYLLLEALPAADRPVWIREAKSRPYLERAADQLRSLIPEAMRPNRASNNDASPPPSADSEARRAMRAYQSPVSPSPPAPEPSPPQPPASNPPQPTSAPPQYNRARQHELDRLIDNQIR